jgi:hypothetical protein
MMHLQQKYAANNAAVRYSFNIAIESLLLMEMDLYKKGIVDLYKKDIVTFELRDAFYVSQQKLYCN